MAKGWNCSSCPLEQKRQPLMTPTWDYANYIIKATGSTVHDTLFFPTEKELTPEKVFKDVYIYYSGTTRTNKRMANITVSTVQQVISLFAY